MLGKSDVIAFVSTKDPAKAKDFYEHILGLKLKSEDPFALVFDAHGTMLRVSVVKEFHPQPFTVLGWKVDDIGTTVNSLTSRNVKFERFPGMNQDADGIWTSPGGAKVAWFKDPDGNTLSLTALH